MPKGELPVMTSAQMADVESKLVTSGLAKLNTGLTPTKLEMEAIERAGQRGAESATPKELVRTDLGFDVELAKTMEERGVHDASRTLQRKPEVFFIIARLLARNTPYEEICELCGCSPHLVQSIADHPEAKLPAAVQKEQFVAKLRLAATLGLGALIKRFQAGEATAVEVGIIIDKLALAEGGVTARTEVIHAHEGEDEWTRLCREARAQMSAAPAAGMVIDAELIPPKAAPPPLADPPSLPDSSPMDIQSLDPGNQTADNQ